MNSGHDRNGAFAQPLLLGSGKKLTVKFDEPVNKAAADQRSSNFPRRKLQRLASDPRDELQRFRFSLLWMGLDQSTSVRVACSWVIFVVFVIVVPIVNGYAVACDRCDFEDFAFERLGSMAESALAIISFTCLTWLLRAFGLRKVLLLDKLDRESEEVQQGYKEEVNNAFALLASILLPSLGLKLAHEIWWFSSVSVTLPMIPHGRLLRTGMCLAVMGSWLYKTSVFLVMCVLFRLMCTLQILRLQGFSKLLEHSLDVPKILLEHVRIRKQLVKISHRCRNFVVASMIVISSSQFVSLFFILYYKESVHFFRAGTLAVCSAVQLSGFLLCMNGAAKITHRAQKIVSLVSEWHAVWTCSSMSMSTKLSNSGGPPPSYPLVRTESDRFTTSDVFSIKSDVSNLENEYYYRQQQALLTYLQHNTAGVSVYGFVLDRGFLYTLFALELSLVLWILGKTITGIH